MNLTQSDIRAAREGFKYVAVRGGKRVAYCSTQQEAKREAGSRGHVVSLSGLRYTSKNPSSGAKQKARGTRRYDSDRSIEWALEEQDKLIKRVLRQGTPSNSPYIRAKMKEREALAKWAKETYPTISNPSAAGVGHAVGKHAKYAARGAKRVAGRAAKSAWAGTKSFFGSAYKSFKAHNPSSGAKQKARGTRSRSLYNLDAIPRQDFYSEAAQHAEFTRKVQPFDFGPGHPPVRYDRKAAHAKAMEQLRSQREWDKEIGVGQLPNPSGAKQRARGTRGYAPVTGLPGFHAAMLTDAAVSRKTGKRDSYHAQMWAAKRAREEGWEPRLPNPGLTKAGKRHLIQTMHEAGADTFRKKMRYVSKHMPHIDDPAAFVGYVMQGEKRGK